MLVNSKCLHLASSPLGNWFLTSNCALWLHVIDSQWVHHLDGMLHLSNALPHGMLGKHFFIGLSVSPWRPCGQSLFLPQRRDDYSSSPSSISLLIFSLSQMSNPFLFHFLAHLVFIPPHCVKILATIPRSSLTFLTAGCHVCSHCLRLTKEMLFVDRWFNWLCVALSEVAVMDRWLGKEALVPAKNESCQAWNC